jgi:plastocyanin
MTRRSVSALVLTALLTVAACSGGPGTSPAGATPVPTAAGTSGAADGPCAPSTAAGTVDAGMADLTFQPAAISAKVGDVVSWTNNDSAPHTATLKDVASCTTDNLAQGATGAIVFTEAGSYPFFCKVHPATMTGTITVSG